MQVGEVLTGVAADRREIEIVTGAGDGDCGFPFVAGIEYLIYAHREQAGRLGIRGKYGLGVQGANSTTVITFGGVPDMRSYDFTLPPAFVPQR